MIIGVDLGGTKVRAGIASGGTIRNEKQQLFRSKGSQHETLTQLKELIRSIVEPGVAGIGLGVPSIIDVEKGIVYDVANIPSWDRVPLKNILESEFSVPVAINNDVNCFALGEHRFGLARGYHNVVGMTSGTGLGCGIIIQDQLFAGSNCGAGEIGLIPYADHNIEYYASGNFFEALHGLSAVTAHDLAIAGDERALALWRAFGRHMAQAIKVAVYAYDPQVIVIGGSLVKAFRFFEASMHQSLGDFTFPTSLARLKIFPSENENITLLGAAALLENGAGSLTEISSDDTLRRT